jgi:hypothetical protein
VSLVGVFQRLFRVLVGGLVIFLAMMYSCHAMGVRGEIVELGRSLMGAVWHGVSFRMMVPRTGRISCLPEPPRGLSMEPGCQGRRPGGQTARSARTTVCSHSTRDVAATRSIEITTRL